METWTFLVITLAAPFEGYQSVIPYPSQDACEIGMDLVPQTMQRPIEMAQCVPSDTLSSSIRPKRRPEGLTNG